jgi:hypothetical protein
MNPGEQTPHPTSPRARRDGNDGIDGDGSDEVFYPDPVHPGAGQSSRGPASNRSARAASGMSPRASEAITGTPTGGVAGSKAGTPGDPSRTTTRKSVPGTTNAPTVPGVPIKIGESVTDGGHTAPGVPVGIAASTASGVPGEPATAGSGAGGVTPGVYRGTGVSAAVSAPIATGAPTAAGAAAAYCESTVRGVSTRHGVSTARGVPTAGGMADASGVSIAARVSPTSRAVGTIRTSGAMPVMARPGGPPRVRVPLASNLGVPAVFEHRVAAIEVGSPVSPVAIHRWTGERLETLVVNPVRTYIWARAGRITVVCRSGAEHRFTVLAPEEYEGVDLGEPWPRHQPQGRGQRIALAAAHDVADVLTFPLWLKRTAHVSGERNKATLVLIRRIHAASPELQISRDATVGVEHT